MHFGIILKCLSGVFVLLHGAKCDSCAGFQSNSPFGIRNHGTVALILARGGSKGIPMKNLAKLNGESILLRALRTIKNSRIFSEIWVSTDNDLIANEAKSLVGVSVHRRPGAVALDTTSSIESVQEFLLHHPSIHSIALIQCTSVFLKETYLIQAHELFQEADCVFSVTRSHKLRWKLINGKLIPVNFNLSNRPRRQDWDGDFLEAGMFYFAKRKLLDLGIFQTNSCKFVEIDPEDSLEIDKQADLELAECLLNARKVEKKNSGNFCNKK
ncbi:N-acylneuraminate cytidylyltransferase [Lutzomyia longipalpis]|uniref:N-acylneuraminate cytidylyltransferase n=1 Tax=Lutzomyia longipalpis TaxID=7200 RepID=UPI002483529B|nr:N-acylneuraminate cytidylyltransferase [Lutzomyia longipalpis]